MVAALLHRTAKTEYENQGVAWYAREAPLGKERYIRLDRWKTRRSIC